MSSSIFVVKRRTAYVVRISDWGSDVCSSDLQGRAGRPRSGPSRRSPPSSRLPRPVAEGELLDLARGGLGQGAEDHRPRRLVLRHVRAAEGDDLSTEERRVGKEGVRTGRTGGAPYSKNKNYMIRWY